MDPARWEKLRAALEHLLAAPEALEAAAREADVPPELLAELLAADGEGPLLEEGLDLLRVLERLRPPEP